MRAVVAGGTGFIGSALVRSLTQDGHEVVVLSRAASGQKPLPGVTFVPAGGRSGAAWSRHLDGPTSWSTWPERTSVRAGGRAPARSGCAKAAWTPARP